jgi:hypothetical protein
MYACTRVAMCMSMCVYLVSSFLLPLLLYAAVGGVAAAVGVVVGGGGVCVCRCVNVSMCIHVCVCAPLSSFFSLRYLYPGLSLCDSDSEPHIDALSAAGVVMARAWPGPSLLRPR